MEQDWKEMIKKGMKLIAKGCKKILSGLAVQTVLLMNTAPQLLCLN